jgi:SSS family solute:Na+ symporter
LTQLARIGSIFFGIGLCLQALTGFSMAAIMIVTGICIIAYAMLGGMEAIIWTDVVQAVILTLGALVVLGLIIGNTPGGVSHIVHIDMAAHKSSLGSFAPRFTTSTFWVVLLYGFFINLNNFGIDQNYVQRYHTARSAKAASRSVWMCVWLYVPVSLLFFVIGAFLYAYYQIHPDLLSDLKYHVAMALAPGSSHAASTEMASRLRPSDYGDKVMPYFIVHKIPAGITGLIISSILSAGMSTISSGMNASATVFSIDIFKRYVKPDLNDKGMLRLLLIATGAMGVLGMGAGLAMIGVKSILDIWWELSGIFAGGMLGLFLLGLVSRRTRNHEALTAVLIGIVVILWMTFSGFIPERYAYLRNPLHSDMIIVVGTLAIFLAGMLWTRRKQRANAGVMKEKEEMA